MLVFFKERLVFLSVPKTGSTAWQQALRDRADMVVSGPPTLKHAPLYRYNRFFRPMFKNVCGVEMDVLAVMREPVSWLGSWYRYRQRPQMRGQPNSTLGLSFDDFVQAYCSDVPPPCADVGNQEKFLRVAAKGVPVRYLFAYEDFAGLTGFLTDRLGPLPPLPRANVSPAGDLSLTAGTEAMLRRTHAPSFALYARLRGG